MFAEKVTHSSEYPCDIKRIAAVPARLESSRLPNKLLADIGGKLMIQRVLERCCKAKNLDAVVLCTDSDQLRELAQGWGFPVLMTSVNCSSGSERIASVADALMAMAWPGEPVDLAEHDRFALPSVVDNRLPYTSQHTSLVLCRH